MCVCFCVCVHNYSIQLMCEIIIISANTKFYACVVTRKDYLERIDGGGYDQEEYEQYPQRYKSTFNKKVRYFFSTHSRTQMHTTFQYTNMCYLHNVCINVDRPIRFGYYQRDILGARLFQTFDGAGRKNVTFSYSTPVDPDIRRGSGTSSQATRDL